MFHKQLHKRTGRQRENVCSTVCILPIELWLIIGSLVDNNLWALASTCHFLSEVLYPLLYRDVLCLTPSMLLRCGSAWSFRPTFIFHHVRTLTVGVSMEDAGNVGIGLEWSGLVSKWRSFTPIIAHFENITALHFIFLALPRTFTVALSSLPMLSDLTLEQCTFRGPATFHGLELKIVHLRLKEICWDNEPDEISLLRSCPLLRVLYLGWHYRIADTLSFENTHEFGSTGMVIRPNEATAGTEDILYVHRSLAWFEDIDAARVLAVAYNGPIHFFRSAIPAHVGLKKAAFVQKHLNLPELQMFLPSLPAVTRVALTGICLKEDKRMGEDALKLVFKRCKLLEEFMIDPAHVPLHGAGWILDLVQRSLHHLQNIRLIYIPRIDAHDLKVEQAFDGLHDICPSLHEIQFQDRKWVFGSGSWTETKVWSTAVEPSVKGLDLGTSVKIEVNKDGRIRMPSESLLKMEILRVMKDCWRKEDDDAQQTNDSMAFDGISWLDAINSLAQFNTLVESAYHLVVCMDDIHTHQKTKHSKSLHLPQELKLPSRAGFWFLVIILNAGKPKVVPVGPIPHIWGVQIVQGLKCAISGCVGAVFSVSQGKSRPLQGHQLREHSEVAIVNHHPVTVSCHPLVLYLAVEKTDSLSKSFQLLAPLLVLSNILRTPPIPAACLTTSRYLLLHQMSRRNNDEDPNVVAVSKSFSHSLDMGCIKSGLDMTGEATGLAADAVAHMQQVSMSF
ncbi:hypothetical protein GG344DRAFT_83319 [Lentinula edodes]|nr:hypothetical protein GG344DRAFT_83319 [Lentinula edodes]